MRFHAWLPLAAFALAAAPVAAEETPSAVPGWDAFVGRLRDLPDRMLAKLPPSLGADPQVRAEVGRVALEALATSTLDTLASDGDHPVFVAALNQTLNVGQPNADTVYRLARIAPGGTYRLRGTRGALRMVRIAEAGPSPGEPGFRRPLPGTVRPVHDLNALRVDAAGRFDVILSPARPAGYAGDWWPLRPDTTRLLMRLVSADWGREAEPAIAIERLDRPAARPRPDAATLEARLRALPVATDAIALLLVDHVSKLRAEGFVNRLKTFDVSQAGGLAGQSYYEGVYALADDEALIVETRLPARCLYRSILLTNELNETTDWANNHSSLNDTQAEPDADGVLRVVVSARDPGVPNWLDTAGHPGGIVQGRWAECDGQPVPSVRKVAFADVRRLLPRDTPSISPAMREQRIRDRSAAIQQRTLW